MGANTSLALTCCCGLRQNNQCCYPFASWAYSYKNKAPFFNFDGSVEVDPLISLYKPTNDLVHKDLIRGMNIDSEILCSGLDPIEQLMHLCKFAEVNRYKVKAVGKGMSWNTTITTRDILVVMTSLNRILPLQPRRGDNEIEVQGGMILEDFAKALHKEFGLGLKTIANFTGQTVAGAISTGSHGSSYHAQNMSSYVTGIRLIISSGVLVAIRGGDETIDQCHQKICQASFGETVEVKSDDVLKCVAVSLGAMGIIYSVTFQCEKRIKIAEERKTTRFPVREGQPFKFPESFEDRFKCPETIFFTVFINQTPKTDSRGGLYHEAVYRQSYVDHSPAGYDCCQSCCCCCLPQGQADPDSITCQDDYLACMASCCLRDNKSCIPKFNGCVIKLMETSDPVKGPYYDVLQVAKGKTHVRTEDFSIPIEYFEEALHDVFEISKMYGIHYMEDKALPILCRLVKADDLPLSTANKHHPSHGGSIVSHYVCIELPFLPGAYGVHNYFKMLENTLLRKYYARPHWGKNNNLHYSTIKKLYPEFWKWEKVYHMFNKNRTFDNEFTVRCGLCPPEDYSYFDPKNPNDTCPVIDWIEREPNGLESNGTGNKI